MAVGAGEAVRCGRGSPPAGRDRSAALDEHVPGELRVEFGGLAAEDISTPPAAGVIWIAAPGRSPIRRSGA